MSKKLTFRSKIHEARDFVLYYKYLSFDEEFGADKEQLLMEFGRVLDSLPETGITPVEIISELIENFGECYE